MFEVIDLQVTYGDLQALHRVSLTLEEGELVALIGPNGAGKTTLLKTIAGLLRPRCGSVRFFGQRLEQYLPNRIVELGISLVPEGRRLFGSMSILENLELGAYPAQARKRRRETLEWVWGIFPILRDRRQQRAGTLSGGEQQMLAIGRALMARPRLLLLDEPSLGLAPLVVERIFEVIREINRGGVTILLVEQNVRMALEVAHRAYILENGQVVGQGTGRGLLDDAGVHMAYLGFPQAEGGVEAGDGGEAWS